jgi:hypothetical protein
MSEIIDQIRSLRDDYIKLCNEAELLLLFVREIKDRGCDLYTKCIACEASFVLRKIGRDK